MEAAISTPSSPHDCPPTEKVVIICGIVIMSWRRTTIIGQSTSFHEFIKVIMPTVTIAGFESGTGFYINPTPPEEAAKYLREIPV